MRSLGSRSVRVPTVAGLSRMGMKIYTVGARRMPSYFRVVYHQKWPRTQIILKFTGGLESGPKGVIDGHDPDPRELRTEDLGTLLGQEHAGLAIGEAQRQSLRAEERE